VSVHGDVPTIRIPLIHEGGDRPEALRTVSRHPLVDVGGAPLSTPATTVSFLSTKGLLFVLFEVSSEPPLRVREASHGPVFQDECVELFLAEPDDPVSYLEVVVNPAGSVYAARVRNPHDDRVTWKLETNRVPDGLEVEISGEPAGSPPSAWTHWSCRLSLPWNAISATGRPPVPGEIRRGNAYRIARGATTRFEALSPTGRVAPPDFHVPSRFARFVFPGAGPEVRHDLAAAGRPVTTAPAESAPAEKRQSPARPATPSAPPARGGPGRRTRRPRRSPKG
jgi:hypothetical protein